MKYRKILFSSILANSLEFYDFTLFSIFLPVLVPTFYQGNFLDRDFIIGWVIFAAGFIMRPVGAIIFGHVGDKLGRKKILSFSILFMAIPTFVIGILPGYNIFGIWAFIILILCRLLQGLCTGGEHNGAAIFSLEHLKNSGKGLVGGLISGSCFIGALTATFMGYLYANNFFTKEGWRTAFALGGIISLIIYKLRQNMQETPEFRETQDSRLILKIPLLSALKLYRPSCFITFTVGLIDGTLCYTLLVFLITYLPRLHGYTTSEVMTMNIVGLLTSILCTPLAGLLSDKLGTHTTMLMSTAATTLFIIPIFMLFDLPNYPSIMLGEFLFGLLIAGILGPQHAFFQTLFPPQMRYSAIGFFYCLGISIGGASIPLILDSLIKIDIHLPIVIASLPFIIYGLIAFIAIYKNRAFCEPSGR